MVWLSCEGKDYNDTINIGDFSYSPFHGFPAYYFPYLNQPGYMAPFVVVQIQNPKSEYWYFGIYAIWHVLVMLMNHFSVSSYLLVSLFLLLMYIHFIMIYIPGNVEINIECKLWARNIFHDRKRNLGLLQFSLFVEDY